MSFPPLDFAQWKLTLPTGSAGDPDEILRPVASRPPWYRRIDDDYVFRANAGGVTTENSDYPRCELRELVWGTDKPAAWSNGAGTHALTMNAKITALPPGKPHLVCAQIHDDDDDVAMVRLEGRHLFLEADGDPVGTLDADYVLGSLFAVQLRANPDGIEVLYARHRQPKARRVHLPWDFSGGYFKAGCYLQSNTDHDEPDAYGQVNIRSLSVDHWWSS